ncbi:hypothetical protein Glove_519g64 [Diversispora epigaea]|uniref:Uncharacterized protein n=1 Tax=Diversispora epigaea TaxID=1348612 RepID=A0A397GF83_9GLOM|nr:hypothetical protein Glove_519g64 [Diversispora epigaea]
MIPNRWYLNPDIKPNDLLQKHPSISICGIAESGGSIEFKKSINFEHFFSIQANSYSSQRLVKSNKAIYAELFELSRKLINYVIKVNLGQELSNKFKILIYDAQNKSIEKGARKEKQVLKNSTNVSNNNIESVTTNINGRKCRNCKQYEYYAKTCPNID